MSTEEKSKSGFWDYFIHISSSGYTLASLIFLVLVIVTVKLDGKDCYNLIIRFTSVPYAGYPISCLIGILWFVISRRTRIRLENDIKRLEKDYAYIVNNPHILRQS